MSENAQNTAERWLTCCALTCVRGAEVFSRRGGEEDGAGSGGGAVEEEERKRSGEEGEGRGRNAVKWKPTF